MAMKIEDYVCLINHVECADVVRLRWAKEKEDIDLFQAAQETRFGTAAPKGCPLQNIYMNRSEEVNDQRQLRTRRIITLLWFIKTVEKGKKKNYDVTHDELQLGRPPQFHTTACDDASTLEVAAKEEATMFRGRSWSAEKSSSKETQKDMLYW